MIDIHVSENKTKNKNKTRRWGPIGPVWSRHSAVMSQGGGVVLGSWPGDGTMAHIGGIGGQWYLRGGLASVGGGGHDLGGGNGSVGVG